MEKGNDSLGLYYLLIVFFVVLIIIPPLFRYLMPNKTNTVKDSNVNVNNTTTNNNNNNNNNTSNGSTNQQTVLSHTLSCSLYATYYIISKYENSNIVDANFTYALKSDITSSTPMNNVYTIINNLKTVPGASIQDTGNQLSVQFAFSNNNAVPDALKQYAQEINTQKTSFESMGFKCVIG